MPRRLLAGLVLLVIATLSFRLLAEVVEQSRAPFTIICQRTNLGILRAENPHLQVLQRAASAVTNPMSSGIFGSLEAQRFPADIAFWPFAEVDHQLRLC